MKNFTSILQLGDINEAVRKAEYVKANPFADQELGRNRTLLMLFFNSSLRTRLSTQKAAHKTQHPESGHEPGDERDGAGCEPGGMETRD